MVALSASLSNHDSDRKKKVIGIVCYVQLLYQAEKKKKNS